MKAQPRKLATKTKEVILEKNKRISDLHISMFKMFRIQLKITRYITNQENDTGFQEEKKNNLVWLWYEAENGTDTDSREATVPANKWNIFSESKISVEKKRNSLSTVKMKQMDSIIELKTTIVQRKKSPDGPSQMKMTYKTVSKTK